MAALLCLCGCGQTGDTQTTASTTEQSTAENSTEPTTEDILTNNPKLMQIATRYGELSYPERWKNIVRTNTVEKNEIWTVEMFAKIGEHPEMHIFDIALGGDEGFCIGTIEDEGETIYVNLISYDRNTDASWSEDEIQTLRMICEDINYTIEELSANQ